MGIFGKDMRMCCCGFVGEITIEKVLFFDRSFYGRDRRRIYRQAEMLEDFFNNVRIGNKSKDNHGSGATDAFESIHMESPEEK
jgi:hypothetical protein